MDISAQTKRRLMEDPELDRSLYEQPGGAASQRLDLPSKKELRQRTMTQQEFDAEVARQKAERDRRYNEWKQKQR